MQGESWLTVRDISPLVIFFWDLITAFSYWDMFDPSTCTRGCWKIFAVCAHIRHIWPSIWKKLEKFLKFCPKSNMCRLSANTFVSYGSPNGPYMKVLYRKIFCFHIKLKYQLSFGKNEFPGFSRFLIFVKSCRNSVRNFRKSRKQN